MDRHKITMNCLTTLVIILGCVHTVFGQSMDPRVSIRGTEPPSDGARLRAFISRDVLIDCYVENLPPELQVNWQRSLYDQQGRETTQLISQDMAVEDNMKWSIEKPTTYTWRLRIKATQISDEGNYTCFVRLTGNNNRAEANRTVLVRDRPDILDAQSSSDFTVQEGDFVPFRCNASGRPLPNIMWRRDGNAILPGGGTRRMGSFFDINNVQYTARGNYICEAFNEVGYDRRNIFLDITFAPKLFPDPARVGQKLGFQRTLKCVIEANPMPSPNMNDNQLSWIYQGMKVFPDERRIIQAIVGAYGRLTLEMTIRSVQQEDYGMYTCMATTVQGTNSVNVELYETQEEQPDKTGKSGAPRHLAAMTSTSVATSLVFLAAYVMSS